VHRGDVLEPGQVRLTVEVAVPADRVQQHGSVGGILGIHARGKLTEEKRALVWVHSTTLERVASS